MQITTSIPFGYTLTCTSTGWRAQHNGDLLIHATEYALARDAIMSHYRNAVPTPPDKIIVDMDGWQD